MFKKSKQPPDIDPPIKGIVTAVGVSSQAMVGVKGAGMGKAIEEGMREAYLQAIADGLRDPDDIVEIKERMQAARMRIRNQHRAAAERSLRGE